MPHRHGDELDERTKTAMARWEVTGKTLLLGRRIIDFFYLEPGPYQTHAAPCIHLDDGTSLIIQSDDEGNDAGSIRVVDTTTTKPDGPNILPRI
jgi:hypothetical protein